MVYYSHCVDVHQPRDNETHNTQCDTNTPLHSYLRMGQSRTRGQVTQAKFDDGFAEPKASYHFGSEEAGEERIRIS